MVTICTEHATFLLPQFAVSAVPCISVRCIACSIGFDSVYLKTSLQIMFSFHLQTASHLINNFIVRRMFVNLASRREVTGMFLH